LPQTLKFPNSFKNPASNRGRIHWRVFRDRLLFTEDHLGGIDEIARNGTYTIVKVFDRGEKDKYKKLKKSSSSFNDYELYVGSKAQQLDPGERLELDELVRITCIASNERVAMDRQISIINKK